MSTLILGIGNIIMSDDGFGPRVIEYLGCRHRFPREVVLVDGGTGGLDLLQFLAGVSNLIVIDAADLGEEPGSLRRLSENDITSAREGRISPHQIGFQDLFQYAALTGCLPERVVLWAVQPARVEPGRELSAIVAAQVETVAMMVLDELARLGVAPCG